MIEIIPNWHPVFVHFTVALLLLSVILYLLARLPLSASLRGEWQVVARWSLWFGAVFAVVTAITGWLAYNSVEHDDISHVAMTEHRDWALTTLALFVLVALWSLWGRLANREPSQGAAGAVFLAVLAAGGILLASTAWHGAELVFRHGLGVMSLPNMGAGDAGRETGRNDNQSPADSPAPVKPPAHDHSTHKH